MRKLIASALVAASLGAVALPAAARVDFYVNVAPPPPRVEVVPVSRVGFVWVPGAWEWRHGRHFWARGHWVRDRPGFVYHRAVWVERGHRWYYIAPGWRHR
ncbi:MAG TPA: hypothetical protein VN598_05430 [Usitatibacter sp.]|nr:hypothetical protein [Usitatibacter sp.]